MLSLRLKEMEKDRIIEKNIVGKSPVLIEYHLTKKGNTLTKFFMNFTTFHLSNTQKKYSTKFQKVKTRH